MTATTPEALHRLWTDRFNAGDLDGLMGLYEPAATMMAQPGTVVSGIEAIRGAISGFLALKPTFTLHFQRAIEADGVALIYSRWDLSGQSPTGPISLSGQTSDVARRQSDGRWLFLIDNPFGGAGADG